MREEEAEPHHLRTYSIEEAAAIICGDGVKDPARWLRRQINSGRITAYKAGKWRMSDQQVRAAIETLSNTQKPDPKAAADTSAEGEPSEAKSFYDGLSARSRRRFRATNG